MKSEAAHALYNTPAIFKHLAEKSLEQQGKEAPVPSMSTSSKLNTWGCPACGVKGQFYDVLDKDLVGCDACKTEFTWKWLAHWDGQTHPELKGKKPLPQTGHPSTWDNPWTPKNEDPDDQLYDLLEKVVAFREAVLNPDRVMTDEDIEHLMTQMFDTTYQISLPGNIEAQTGTLDVIEDEADLAPDIHDSKEAYHNQLLSAYNSGIITLDQAHDLLKAFGGDDPFPAKILHEGEVTPEVSPEVILSKVHDSVMYEFKDMTDGHITFDGENIDGLNFWTAEMLDHLENDTTDYIDPFGDT